MDRKVHKRFLLRLAYNGIAFLGWQSQSGGTAVQDVVEAALARVVGAPVRVHGAGRTDAGVHASGQCAHFDVDLSSRLSTCDWLRALNAYLPAEVRVLSVKSVRADFHARFSATGKHYRYLIDTHTVLSPFAAQRVWHLPVELDDALLKSAISLVQGKHDFRAFAANRGKPELSTMRNIHSATTLKKGRLIRVDLLGEGFLYKMVRMIVGAAARVACGKETLAWMESMLDPSSAVKNKHVAPAEGLYLMRVFY